MVVPRELFPLPSPFPSIKGASPPSSTGCRAVTQRARQRYFFKQRANEAVRCLNELYGCGTFDHELRTPSAAQLQSLRNVEEVINSPGAPACTPQKPSLSFEAAAQGTVTPKTLVALSSGNWSPFPLLVGRPTPVKSWLGLRLIAGMIGGAFCSVKNLAPRATPDRRWSPTLTGL